MLIVGEKESKDGTVSIRKRFEGDLGAINVDKFKQKLKIDKKINGRKLSELKDEEVPHILSPFNVKE